MIGYELTDCDCFSLECCGNVYEYLGVQRTDTHFIFRVWCPDADEIFVVGDFNSWCDNSPMKNLANGIWEAKISSDMISYGSLYKYKIICGDKTLYKADPYSICTKKAPETASVIYDLSEYVWRDNTWLAYRGDKQNNPCASPMNIYELHAESWKQRDDGSPCSWSELAWDLAPYVKRMGYTHIELMSVIEHYSDISNGERITSCFAPAPVMGTPHEFMGFIDSMHEAGIGVIIDWLPLYFAEDEHGLTEFNGQPLYECNNSEKIKKRKCSTRYFDISKQEVKSFLISNALFWVEKYHIDGLKIKLEEEDICFNEIQSFWCELCNSVKKSYSDVLLIAETDKNCNSVSVADNCFGFDMVWHSEWTNSILSYMSDGSISESLKACFNGSLDEHLVLSLSHNDVLYGKNKALIDRSNLSYEQKFAVLRLVLGYQMTFVGKKLLFMGSEIGQFQAWDYRNSVEWFLLDYDAHAKLQYYVAELNHFYLENSSLWKKSGFKLISDGKDNGVIVYERFVDNQNKLLVVLNFSQTDFKGYRVDLEDCGAFKEVFNSDAICFGGNNCINHGRISTEESAVENFENSLSLDIPAFGMVVLSVENKE